MTAAGPPILIGGGVQVGAAITLSGALTLTPGISVPPAGAAGELDDLADVDAPPTQPGVLARGTDGQVRPVSRTEIVAAHVADPEPHPAYDDMPSLRLLFENGLI